MAKICRKYKIGNGTSAMHKLKKLRNYLWSSFWFLPSLIVAASIAFAMGLIAMHTTGSEQWLNRWPHIYGASAEGARGIMSAIAGSVMTVVGVTYSMTLVALALASSQYTSRILRNFMSDRITQIVLGILAGIFTYCLMVLRTIRGGDFGGFVPSLAVFFGVVLAICGIAALIFFINHIASSIQASSIIASVADETLAAVDRLFPDKLEQEPVDGDEEQALLQHTERTWQSVHAHSNGYIQSVNNETLMFLARKYKTIVRMECGIGDFVIKNTAIASFAMESPPPNDIAAALQEAYSIDRYRTVHQDPAFGIRQIVDMALRALSPSINDTTTAVMCVDYLLAILARLVSRNIPSLYRYEDKDLRIIAIGPTFASLTAESFDQIRVSAAGNTAIMVRMLGAFQTIASLTANENRRQTLREQVLRLMELAARTIESPYERAEFENRLERVRKTLDVGNWSDGC
jgi:uncharacterized membrane protein